MRAVILHPLARETIRGFPKDVRHRLGRSLFLLQKGETLGMPHSRPMPSVAAGVSEIRVSGQDGVYRTFVYVASAEGILVLHAFMKKTAQTPDREVVLARSRLKELRYA